MWLTFLQYPSIYARNFIDLDKTISSKEVNFYTDASANAQLGCGGICGEEWFIQQWDDRFINQFKTQYQLFGIVYYDSGYIQTGYISSKTREYTYFVTT